MPSYGSFPFASVAAFNAAKSGIAGNSAADTLGFSSAVSFNDDTLAGMTTVLLGPFPDTQFEYLTLAGSGTDNVTLGANAQAVGIVSVSGGAGTNNINASAYSVAITLLGGSGIDSLFGGDSNDWIDGAAGNNSLRGGAGNDTFISGSGTDRLDGGAGADSISTVSLELTGSKLELTLTMRAIPRSPTSTMFSSPQQD